MSQFQVATIQDVITDALRLCLAQMDGEDISAENMQFAARELNRLMGKWSIIRTFCVVDTAQVFTFGTSKNAYTIGPTSVAFPTDFNGPRPSRISKVNIILNTSAPSVYSPVQMLDWGQWSEIRVRAIPSGVPTAAYYDGGYTSVGATAGQPNLGYGTIYFWGQPLPASYQCELWVPQLLPQYASLAGSGGYFNFPPGYEEAIVPTLAEMLSISYGRAIPQDLKDRARRGRAALQSLNSRPSVVNTDVPGSDRGGGYFNWLSRSIV